MHITGLTFTFSFTHLPQIGYAVRSDESDSSANRGRACESRQDNRSGGIYD